MTNKQMYDLNQVYILTFEMSLIMNFLKVISQLKNEKLKL